MNDFNFYLVALLFGAFVHFTVWAAKKYNQKAILAIPHAPIFVFCITGDSGWLGVIGCILIFTAILAVLQYLLWSVGEFTSLF